MASGGIEVQGIRELQILFHKAGPEANRDIRATLRQVAEPIRSDWESLAVSSIPRVGRKWSRARVGVTRGLVYVAPKQRGVKGRGDRRARPKFGTLLATRVSGPALARNVDNIERDVNEALEALAKRWTNA